MSRNARIGLVIGAVALVVVAFVALRPGSEGGSGSDNAATTTATTSAPAPTTTAPKPKPAVPTVKVRNGKPVGGVKKIEVSEGGRIRFRVTDDAESTVHLHGYDIEKSVGPGNPASFNVKATITGRFEVELHPATQVADVTVNP